MSHPSELAQAPLCTTPEVYYAPSNLSGLTADQTK
jgi:hypothetical protein